MGSPSQVPLNVSQKQWPALSSKIHLFRQSQHHREALQFSRTSGSSPSLTQGIGRKKNRTKHWPPRSQNFISLFFLQKIHTVRGFMSLDKRICGCNYHP